VNRRFYAPAKRSATNAPIPPRGGRALICKINSVTQARREEEEAMD